MANKLNGKCIMYNVINSRAKHIHYTEKRERESEEEKKRCVLTVCSNLFPANAIIRVNLRNGAHKMRGNSWHWHAFHSIGIVIPALQISISQWLNKDIFFSLVISPWISIANENKKKKTMKWKIDEFYFKLWFPWIYAFARNAIDLNRIKNSLWMEI